MKIYIGPYVDWIGPYQIAKKIMFWKNENVVGLDVDRDTDSVHRFGDWLATNSKGEPSLLSRFCNWLYNKRARRVEIRVDDYDVWSMDHTLAMVIVPMLKKLKEKKHGGPHVDDEDVPAHLRSTAAPELTEEQKNCGHTDDNWFPRWDWVLDEMIWAFEQHASGDEWREQYYSGESDMRFVISEDSAYSTLEKGPNDTFKVDRDGMNKHSERMANGRRLFAKYYDCLWD